MSYLIDTDTLSNPLKRSPSLMLLRRLAVVPPEEQFTSTITVGEMVYGAYKSQRPEYFLQRLESEVWPNIRILPFDTAAAVVYGRVRRQLENLGTTVAEPDLRIASIALARGLTLVTGNLRHFSHVPDLPVENWFVEEQTDESH
jgi:tRNA(fMet)-specific endonuclease VapC